MNTIINIYTHVYATRLVAIINIYTHVYATRLVVHHTHIHKYIDI